MSAQNSAPAKCWGATPRGVGRRSQELRSRAAAAGRLQPRGPDQPKQ